jgi:hypothetical protein
MYLFIYLRKITYRYLKDSPFNFPRIKPGNRWTEKDLFRQNEKFVFVFNFRWR